MKCLLHHKQQLRNLQQTKKSFLTSQAQKALDGASKNVEALMKTQEWMFKKQLKQYSSKVPLQEVCTAELQKTTHGGLNSETI